MNAADLDTLAAKYIALASLHARTEYSLPESVRAANRAADEMREIALEACARGYAHDLFTQLLTDHAAAIWSAHHTLELLRASGPLGHRALAVIEERAATDFGEAAWLQQWRARGNGA